MANGGLLWNLEQKKVEKESTTFNWHRKRANGYITTELTFNDQESMFSQAGYSCIAEARNHFPDSTYHASKARCDAG